MGGGIANAQHTTIPPNNREGDENFKKEREAWIRQMHVTAPDVNWEVIERENREARILKREQTDRDKSAKVLYDTAVGTWTERGSNNLAGRMLATEIDWEHNNIYTASAGGMIWRGTLDGKNWTSLNDNQRFGSINTIRIIKTETGNRLFVCGDNPFFRYSDDYGKTWKVAEGLDVPKGYGGFRRATVSTDGKNTIYIVGTEWDYSSNWRAIMCLYRSTDLGKTFQNVRRSYIGINPNVTDVYAPRQDLSSDVYFLCRDSLSRFKSDLTEEFIGIVNSAELLTTPGDAALFGNSSQHLAIGISGGEKSTVYTSSNEGKTWTLKGSLPLNTGKLNFCMSVYDENYMYTGGLDVYRSVDGGKTWKIVNGWGEYYGDMLHKLHADIQTINTFATPDDDEITLITNDGGIYYSKDQVESVTNIGMEGLAVSQYYSTLTSSLNPKVVFAGSQDQGYQKTTKDTNGRFTFEQKISGDYGHLSSGDGGSSLWMDYPGFVLYRYNTMSEEKEMTWNWIANSINNALWMPPVQCEPNVPDIAYFGGGSPDAGAYLYKIFRKGVQLDYEKLPFDFKNSISAIAISEVNPDIRYVITTAGTFFYSGDKGKNWNQLTGFTAPGNHYFYGTAICISPLNPKRVYVGGSGYSNPGVYLISENDGTKTIDTMNLGLPNTMIYSLAVTPDDKFVFAATENGAYMYSNEKGRWFDITSEQAPDQLYWSVEYVPSLKVARFGTYGRGIWDYSLKEIVSGIDDDTKTKSQDFPLSVQPNPISLKADIVFTLPMDGEARLRIYDLSGKIVAEPFSGFANYGENRISWNALSFGGTQLPSGSYMCMLTAFGRSQYAKLLVK